MFHMHVHRLFPQAYTAQHRRLSADYLICRVPPAVWSLPAISSSNLSMSTDVDPNGSSRQISLIDCRGSLIDIPDSGMILLGRQNIPVTAALTATKVSRSARPCSADLSSNGMTAAHRSFTYCHDTSGLNVRLALVPRPRVPDVQ